MTETTQFEKFMREHQNMVYSTSLRMLANESDAKDIAQEVFLKAFERFEQLKDNPSAGGWLRTVATNLSLNHLTRYRRRWRFFSDMVRSDEDGEHDVMAEIPAPETSDSMGEADKRRVLENALQRLPEGQRVPIVLYHFEGRSYEEISELTRTSLSKVKTDIFRGREALKKKLRIDLAGEEGWEEYSGSSSRNLSTPQTPRTPLPSREPVSLIRKFLKPVTGI